MSGDAAAAKWWFRFRYIGPTDAATWWFRHVAPRVVGAEPERTMEFRDAVLAYAKQRFWLNEPIGGAPREEHLQQAARSSRPVDDVSRAELPRIAERAWNAFLRLSAQRGVAGGGPAALSVVSVDAWCRCVEPLKSWEVLLIFDLDEVWFAALRGRRANG